MAYNSRQLKLIASAARLYVSNPGGRAQYYTELAVSSPAVEEIIASTHCTYSRRMASLSGPE